MGAMIMLEDLCKYLITSRSGMLVVGAMGILEEL